MKKTFTFTAKDFANENQWAAFKTYINRSFVKAYNKKYNEVIEEFAEDHITVNEITDPSIERDFEKLKDLAKEEPA